MEVRSPRQVLYDDLGWQIVTLWRSRADVDAYVASVSEPFAIGLFRKHGGVPEVAVFEVVVDSNAPWWP